MNFQCLTFFLLEVCALVLISDRTHSQNTSIGIKMPTTPIETNVSKSSTRPELNGTSITFQPEFSGNLGCRDPNGTNNPTLLVHLKPNATSGNSDSNISSTFHIPEGSEAIYRCRDESKFKFDGQPSRFCYQGRWIQDKSNLSSPLLPPRCIPKDYCNTPDLRNGTLVTIDGQNATENQTYVIGSVALYRCISSRLDFIHANNSQIYRRVCDPESKTWIGTVPQCEKQTAYLYAFEVSVAVVCSLSILLFSLVCFILYKRTKKPGNDQGKGRVESASARRSRIRITDRPSVRRSYEGFYSFQETPDEREFASIHRPSQRSTLNMHQLNVRYTSFK